MGTAQGELTPDELQALRYPTSICKYEMAAGIIRQEIGGIVYVSVPDYAWTFRALDHDIQERERKRRGDQAAKAYADHAAAYYGGGEGNE